MTMETNPKRFLFRMILFLVLVGVLAAILARPLAAAFLGNPVLNGVILGAFAVGTLYVIRQTLRLMPERDWLLSVKNTGRLDSPHHRPILLATVYAMLADSRHDAQLSALSLRSVLDGVAARLDEGREISRYMIGLMVFLGLLGTFWGLLQTIGAVGNVVASIDSQGTTFETMMGQLRAGLDAPLSGMATAFSSSLFGLAGSLILGFLDLQLGQAMGRFFNELEDWLSAFARFNDSNSGSTGTGALASGMSEEAARALLNLSQAITSGEDDRKRMLDQITKLTSTLAQLAESLSDNERIRDHLAQLNANILKLSEDFRDERERQTSVITSELRGLSTSIGKTLDQKPGRGKAG
jgi:hypothetical protein